MRFLAFALAFLLLLTPDEGLARQMDDASIAVLRTIDKLSARRHTFDIPVDKTVKFGNSLFIKVRACRKASPLDQPEDAAFLQIWERKPTEQNARWVFSGWMFSSSPALSAIDHPVYDVWVIACKNAAMPAKPADFSKEAEPAEAPDTATAEENEEQNAPAKDTPKAEEAFDGAPPEKEEDADIPEQRPAAPMPPLEQLPGSFEDGGSEEIPADTGD